MATTKRRRRPVSSAPDWVTELLETHRPPPGNAVHQPPAFQQYIGWKFFGEPVPGLPPADSEAGRALVARMG